jgi:signal transduction histidine kinase
MLMMIDQPECDQAYIKGKINLLFKDIERIKNIIEHVRIFSRDQQKTRYEEVNVNRVFYDAMSLVRKMLEGEKISIIEDCSTNESIILGNPYQLEQVFLNLISNARHAVNEKERKLGKNGYVKQITITCNQNGNKIELKVKDNGIGIPPEILTNIFNPFFTTKSETKGTGLGLSISYGIIHDMKGDITAESVENEYTTMKISLPVYSSDQ